MAGVLLLGRSDVRRVMAWGPLVAAVRTALIERASGGLPLPAAAQMTLPGALLHLKAGALVQPPILSVKANLRVQGARAAGVVVLYDTTSGQVAAIMDSADFTAMRTAVLATIAAEALSQVRPAHLALIGAGPVARQVLDVLPRRLGVASIRIWSRSRANAEDAATASPIPATICDTPADAARHATILCTATPSRTPLLGAGDLADGALVLAMGADSPGKRELDDSVLADAAIVADQREDVVRVGECAYAGEATAHRIVELGDILAGTVPSPAGAARLTVFDSVGSAIIDATAAAALLTEARARGIGTPFDLSA